MTEVKQQRALNDVRGIIRDAVYDALSDYAKKSTKEDAHILSGDLGAMANAFAEQWCVENPF